MSMKMNNWTGIGYMGDNVIFTAGEGDVQDRAWFTLGVNRKRQKGKTDWIPVVCWGKQAVAMRDHTEKGKELTIVGELHTSREVREDGTYNNRFEVSAEYISFGNSSPKAHKNNSPAPAKEASNSTTVDEETSALIAAAVRVAMQQQQQNQQAKEEQASEAPRELSADDVPFPTA